MKQTRLLLGCAGVFEVQREGCATPSRRGDAWWSGWAAVEELQFVLVTVDRDSSSLSLPRELKDSPASAGLRIRLS